MQHDTRRSDAIRAKVIGNKAPFQSDQENLTKILDSGTNAQKRIPPLECVRVPDFREGEVAEVARRQVSEFVERRRGALDEALREELDGDHGGKLQHKT